MTVVFGSTRQVVPTEAQDAFTFIARPDWIFSVETPSETSVWSYSLHPEQGMAFFTRHATGGLTARPTPRRSSPSVSSQVQLAGNRA